MHALADGKGGVVVIADQGDGVLMHGTTCAYCLWRFTSEADEAITVCQSCGTPYHVECFYENAGCATFGCPAWVSSQAAAGVPGVVVPPPAPPQPMPAPAVTTRVASAPLSPTPEPVAPVAEQPTTVQRWNFCSQCGSRLETHYDFCIQCGQRIGRSE
jgi:hypothetical protein